MDGVRILQFIIILIPILVVLYLLRLAKTLNLEKRLANFALTSTKDEEISFFDRLIYYFWIVVHKLSKLFKKSHVLRNYATKYEKYISFEDRDKKEGIDYITIKFLFGFVVFVMGIVTLIIHYKEFNGIILFVVILFAFFLPDIYLAITFSQKKKRIEEDLFKAVIIMNNAFNSGKNIMQAIQIVKSELDGPIKDEFEKIYLDITYGLSLDVVFNRFYERVKIEDAKYITSTLTLLNKTGGDIVKVFSMLEKSILDKKNLKNEFNSLTSSSRFVFKFLAFLPFVFVLIIFLLNPTYFMPLFTSSIGIFVFILILVLYILYILAIRKVLEVRI